MEPRPGAERADSTIGEPHGGVKKIERAAAKHLTIEDGRG
jgi:hypothetical protein